MICPSFIHRLYPPIRSARRDSGGYTKEEGPNIAHIKTTEHEKLRLVTSFINRVNLPTTAFYTYRQSNAEANRFNQSLHLGRGFLSLRFLLGSAPGAIKQCSRLTTP